ncbi:MAG: tryptophan synthase subunit beta, partial [Planctomycetaceae bacterium]|nr:tryptophan synthase subunit beta [Planctomycetaceae bacterium]
MADISPSTSNVPNEAGRFGLFGGRYVPETLTKALNELTTAYTEAKQDSVFQNQLTELFNDFVGRPSPLYFAERLTAHCGGAEIWLKREDT